MTELPKERTSEQQAIGEMTISDQAIEWMVMLGSGSITAQKRTEFDRWYQQNPAHQDAMREAEELFGAIGKTQIAKAWQENASAGKSTHVTTLEDGDMMPSRQGGLSDMKSPNAYLGQVRGNNAPNQRPKSTRNGYSPSGDRANPDVLLQKRRDFRGGMGRQIVFGAAVLSLALVLVVLRPMVGPISGYFSDYRTSVGEVRKVELPDGSSAFLNSASALSVDYSPAQRIVHLRAGEAVFEVAKNPDRPFVVVAANGQARAVGTAYDVFLDEGKTHISVLHGIVAVSTDDPDVKPVQLHAGEQASYDEDGKITPIGSENSQRELSWMRGKLIFNRQPLGKVIEDVQRYYPGKLILANTDLADMQVTGVFSLDQLGGFIASLEKTTPAKVFTTPVFTVIY